MKTQCEKLAIRCAFSRLDLIVLICVVFLFALWFGFNHMGERGRIVRCGRNLEALGKAMQSYANDNSDGLPAAWINLGNTKLSWDADLAPYINGNSARTKSIYEKKTLLPVVRPWFVCPSDPFPRKNPRSYAVSGRDMSYGWPPGPDDATGVFLWWDKSTITNLSQSTAAGTDGHIAWLPKVKLSVLPDPANTLLITELIGPGNNLGNPGHIRLLNADEQQVDSKCYHFGKFNYLMADGHVDLLSELQTGCVGNPPEGIWTIRAGD